MEERIFHQIDCLRRMGGNWLEAFGPGRVEIPNEIIMETAGVRLREYRSAEAGSVLFIVPAPIKRYYIWDLDPESSVVAQAIAEGFHVYVAEWTEAPIDYGLTEYVAILHRCVMQLRQRGYRPIHIATHSLGGILSVAFVALYPTEIKTLVLIETPLHFGQHANAFVRILAAGPSGHEVAARFGSVPGSFLSVTAATAYPAEFGFERYVDWVACMHSMQQLATHMRVERWAMDELPLPGALYAEVVDDLYRRNSLMRGDLIVSGKRIGPDAVGLPLVFVLDPWCRVVAPEAIMPFYAAVASTQKVLLSYPGESGVALRHVGALVGRAAHQKLWPRIFGWLRKNERVH